MLKHDNIKQIEVCEIDKKVIEISKRHFPNLANSFDDTRVKIYCEDGDKFIKKHQNEYDLIVVDSSDPIGPAEVLFSEAFFQSMYKALNKGGIVVSQAESFFYHKKIIKHLFSFIEKIFVISKYYYTLVPSYPSGIIGFTFCSKKYHPLDDFNEKKTLEIKNLKYYDKDIHKSSFALPVFVQDYKK